MIEVFLKQGKDTTSLFVGPTNHARRYIKDNAIVLKSMGIRHVMKRNINRKKYFKLDLDLVLKSQMF